MAFTSEALALFCVSWWLSRVFFNFAGLSGSVLRQDAIPAGAIRKNKPNFGLGGLGRRQGTAIRKNEANWSWVVGAGCRILVVGGAISIRHGGALPSTDLAWVREGYGWVGG